MPALAAFSGDTAVCASLPERGESTILANLWSSLRFIVSGNALCRVAPPKMMPMAGDVASRDVAPWAEQYAVASKSAVCIDEVSTPAAAFKAVVFIVWTW